jgi:hypothetical protein
MKGEEFLNQLSDSVVWGWCHMEFTSGRKIFVHGDEFSVVGAMCTLYSDDAQKQYFMQQYYSN